MKILITGSSGFVGTHLSKLLSKKNEIISLDLKNGEDIFDEKLLTQKMNRVEVVIHLAAFISAMESWQKEEEYYKNNALGTLRVFNAAKQAGVKRLIFFSSAAVKAEPKTPYAISKIAAEEILNLHKSEMEIIILRPENIYGPGQKADYGYVIHNFIKASKENKEITIYGDGSQTRDFIYIKDVIETVEKLINIDYPGIAPISLGTGIETNIKELAEKVIYLTKSKSIVKYALKRNEPDSSVAETSKLSGLGIHTNGFMDLKSGIKELLILSKSK